MAEACRADLACNVIYFFYYYYNLEKGLFLDCLDSFRLDGRKMPPIHSKSLIQSTHLQEDSKPQCLSSSIAFYDILAQACPNINYFFAFPFSPFLTFFPAIVDVLLGLLSIRELP